MAEAAAVTEAVSADTVDVTAERTQVEGVLTEFGKKKKKRNKQPRADEVEVAEAAARDEAREEARLRYRAQLSRVHELLHPDGEPHEKERLKLPPPEVARPGSKAATVVNFGALCAKLGRPPEHVAAYVQTEVGHAGSIDAESRLRLKYVTQKKLEQLVRRYAREYVQCHACGSCATTMLCDRARSRLHFLLCAACRSERRVMPIQRGYVAVGRGDRRAARAGAPTSAGGAMAAGVAAGVETVGGVAAANADVAADQPDIEVADAAADTMAAAAAEAARSVDARQATLNVGIIGHVAHGKSSLVRALTGVRTQKHKQELERNITIRLGYANVKLYACSESECPPAERYTWRPSSCAKTSLVEGGRAYVLIRHVSFVDCPGHEALMSNMLSGAAVMDAALLLVAANEPCPAPQTAEHLAAAECVGLRHVLPVHNKIDLVSESAASEHHEQLCDFVQGTTAADSAVTPVCAQLGYNLGAVCAALAAVTPPARDVYAPARALLIRSFDVNRPGCVPAELRGGVVGGAVVRGVLVIGQCVEIRPGLLEKNADGTIKACTPLRTVVTSLHSETTPLQDAHPGGLIGIGTTLDPILTKEDRLKGQLLGVIGTLPPIRDELTLQLSLLGRTTVLAAGDAAGGICSGGGSGGERAGSGKLRVGERLLVSAGALSVGARVARVTKDGRVSVSLDEPVCSELGETVALSRKLDGKWRLYGKGEVLSGREITPQPPLVDAASVLARDGATEAVAQSPSAETAEEAAAVKAAEVTTMAETAVAAPVEAPSLVAKSEEEQADVGASAENCVLSRLHSCRFYERRLPEVDEVVVCTVTRLDESAGVYVSLLAYGGVEAMVPLAELSRRRKGRHAAGAAQLTRVGKLEVCVVLRVDEEKGYVDLSRWRVEDEERLAAEKRHARAKLVHSVVVGASLAAHVSMEDVYEASAWALARHDGLDGVQPYNLFALAASRPELVFNVTLTPSLQPSVRTALLSEIHMRLAPSTRTTVVKATIELRCVGTAGVHAVQHALQCVEAVGASQRARLVCQLVAPPLWMVRCENAQRASAVALVHEAIEAARAAVCTHAGGALVVRDVPAAVDEACAEADELATRLTELVCS